MNSRKYRPEIDGLRAIAVLSVLAFHIGFSRFGGGFVGVDVFFVISGYLITGMIVDELLDSGRFNFLAFYTRRIRRLMPAVFATAALTWLASWSLLALPHFVGFNQSFLAAIFSVSNIYFFYTSGYFDAIASVKPLLHTWSLGVEMQFYLVWPILLVVCLRQGRMKLLLWTTLVLGLLSLLANIALVEWIPQHTDRANAADAAFYLTPFRVFEFAIGAALILLRKHKIKSRLIAEVILAAGIALIAYAVMTFTTKMPFPSYFALIPCFGAALVIYAERATFGNWLLSAPSMRYIGEISYSIYLTHWPTIVLYRYAQRYFTNLSPSAPTPWDPYILIAITGCSAVVLFHFVEKPFRLKSRGAFISTADRSKISNPFLVRALVPILLTGFLLAALGVVCNIYSGWPLRTRISSEMLARYGNAGFNNFKYDYYGGIKCRHETKGRICNAGPAVGKGKLTWVLGDSHALALKAGLDRFASHPYRLVSDPCAFYSAEYCAQPSATPHMMEFRDKVFRTIRQTNDPVVLSSYWQQLLSPQVTANRKQVVRLTNLEEMAAFKAAQLKRLKADLPNNKITVIGALPAFYGTLTAPQCLALPKVIASADKRLCDRGPASGNFLPCWGCSVFDLRDFNRALKKDLAGTGIEFIDPFPFFCNADTCARIIDGKILFSDEDHLSTDGSIHLIRRIIDRL